MGGRIPAGRPIIEPQVSVRLVEVAGNGGSPDGRDPRTQDLYFLQDARFHAGVLFSKSGFFIDCLNNSLNYQ